MSWVKQTFKEIESSTSETMFSKIANIRIIFIKVFFKEIGYTVVFNTSRKFTRVKQRKLIFQKFLVFRKSLDLYIFVFLFVIVVSEALTIIHHHSKITAKRITIISYLCSRFFTKDNAGGFALDNSNRSENPLAISSMNDYIGTSFGLNTVMR